MIEISKRNFKYVRLVNMVKINFTKALVKNWIVAIFKYKCVAQHNKWKNGAFHTSVVRFKQGNWWSHHAIIHLAAIPVNYVFALFVWTVASVEFPIFRPSLPPHVSLHNRKMRTTELGEARRDRRGRIELIDWKAITNDDALKMNTRKSQYTHTHKLRMLTR